MGDPDLDLTLWKVFPFFVVKNMCLCWSGLIRARTSSGFQAAKGMSAAHPVSGQMTMTYDDSGGD